MKTLPFPLVALKTIIQGTSSSFLEKTIDEISLPPSFSLSKTFKVLIYNGPVLSPLFSPFSLGWPSVYPTQKGGRGKGLLLENAGGGGMRNAS